MPAEKPGPLRMKGQRKKRDSDGGLPEDLRHCQGLLAAGNLTPEEEEKVRKRIFVMRLYASEWLSLLQRKAEQLGLPEFWRGVDTEAFVKLVADYLNNDAPILRRVGRAAALSVCAELGISDPAKVREIVDAVSLTFSQSMLDELQRRQSQAETKDGLAVRRFLVELDERGERLAALGRSISKGLWIPGDKKEGGADARSEAIVEIFDKLKTHLTTSPVQNPETLRAFVQGSFNSVPHQIRDVVRGRIETELRRSSHYITRPARQASGEPLIEMIADPKQRTPADQDHLLFE